MNTEKLLQLNALGIIPGPHETEEDFQHRADYCLNLAKNFETEIDLGNSVFSEKLSRLLIEKTGEETNRLYGIISTWVPIIFSNNRLLPWHGGCAWIFKTTPDGPVSAFFQLRTAFMKSPSYLGIYDRSELIAHESSHIGRMAFEEPKFEELIAYRTAKTTFRRIFGPLVQSNWEANAFILSLFLSTLAPFLARDYPWMNWLMLLPLFLVLLALGRIALRQSQFSRCYNNLRKLFSSDEAANAVIYRLTDQEIIRFSHMSSEGIMDYIQKKKIQELRWKVIVNAYKDSMN